MSSKTDQIILAAGCFWCVESVFQRVTGVQEVESGYTGGVVENPTYGQVCGGQTGHAEALKVVFDPSKVSTEEILDIFFKAHDPTTKNRQGADVGTQYRSAVFYNSPEQRELAHQAIERAQPKLANNIVTEVAAAGPWYPAEKNHQNYYNRNKNDTYCRYVIHPKLKKVKHDKFKGEGIMAALMR